SKTVKIRNASKGFYDFTVSGTVSQSNALDVSHTLATSGAGTWTTSGNNITGDANLSLVGTGGLTGSTSSITVTDVTVGAGTTLSMSSGTLHVKGNWNSSAGTFTFGTSTISVEG